MVRNYLYATIFALIAGTLAASAYTEFNRYGTDVTSDMALIYAGGQQRPDWTVEEVMPYVVHTYSDGHKDWFFDAFLVLEFSDRSRDLGFQNGVGSNYATKEDWLWLLDRQLDGVVTSLDSAIAIGRNTLGEPRLRHKIVMAMPAPIKAQGRNWGELNGRRLDFASEDDRTEASKWFVTELIKRFDARKFNNIDLTGIYWLEEGLYTNDNVVPRVNDWIYRNKLRSYWIPYYKDNAQFRFNWHDKYGFDVAYQQPNYFFERDIPLQRLYDACDESKRYGMALEMEFESQGTSRVQHDDPDSYYTRLTDYLDVFEQRGVFDESAVAWYSGTKGFIHLAESTDPHNHLIADRMASIVARRQAAKKASLEYPKNAIRDLALIWQGGERRIDWTEDQFVPYVQHTFADGSREWTFDGFLFLESDRNPDIRYFPWAGHEGATKADWEWYLNRLFEKGKSLDALDKCISRLKKEIGEPGFKHQIMLTQLVPIRNNKHWGKLNGKKLDFSNTDDQIAACQWFIDQLISRFNKAGYKNLELNGIYWLDEDMCHTDGFPRHIAPYIHSKGLQFAWIPYFKGRGYEKWRELGFDIAYQQPGHYFDRSTPDKRLDEACDVSLVNGMGLEFECESSAMSQAPDSKMDRMQAYIDAFERHGVWDTSAVAYYTGSKALLDMFENPSPENQLITDRLCRIIVDRRAKTALNPKK